MTSGISKQANAGSIPKLYFGSRYRGLLAPEKDQDPSVLGNFLSTFPAKIGGVSKGENGAISGGLKRTPTPLTPWTPTELSFFNDAEQGGYPSGGAINGDYKTNKSGSRREGTRLQAEGSTVASSLHSFSIPSVPPTTVATPPTSNRAE
jgi:hypothetical protein